MARPEPPPIPDEAVWAALRAWASGYGTATDHARHAVEAAAPFIRAPLEAENAWLQEHFNRTCNCKWDDHGQPPVVVCGYHATQVCEARAQAIRDVVQALRDRADAIRGVVEALQDDEQRGFHEWADRQAPSDFIERWARERGDL